MSKYQKDIPYTYIFSFPLLKGSNAGNSRK
uniref:Uncharacterized protein n=1 Tax=Rhizophora mucronata TaxID=61149 RepID=A0A2P2MXL4_RHIMU